METAPDRRSLRKRANQLIREAEELEREIAVFTNGEPPNLVGTKEAAEILGLRPDRVSQMHARKRFVEPIVVLACGPIWHRADIEAWRQ